MQFDHFRADVEEFAKFAHALEAKYVELADKTDNTEVSIGQLFQKDYENFLKVSLKKF